MKLENAGRISEKMDVILRGSAPIGIAHFQAFSLFSRPNCWDLPGGNVLFGENHLDSLIREIKEESSLEIKDIRPIQVVTNYEKQVYFLFIGYSCKAVSSRVKLSEEHQEYRWVTKDRFLDLESAGFLIDLVNQTDR